MGFRTTHFVVFTAAFLTVGTGARPINVVVIGKTGSGKSATSATLYGHQRGGDELFPSSSGIQSYTKDSIEQMIDWDGSAVKIQDTLGFYDNTMSFSAQQKLLARSMSLLSQVDVFLWCIEKSRFTALEHDLLTSFFQLAGPRVQEHTILVFTKSGDETKDDLAKEFKTLGSKEPLAPGDPLALLKDLVQPKSMFDFKKTMPFVVMGDLQAERRSFDQKLVLDTIVKFANGNRLKRFDTSQFKHKVEARIQKYREVAVRLRSTERKEIMRKWMKNLDMGLINDDYFNQMLQKEEKEEKDDRDKWLQNLKWFAICGGGFLAICLVVYWKCSNWAMSSDVFARVTVNAVQEILQAQSADQHKHKKFEEAFSKFQKVVAPEHCRLFGSQEDRNELWQTLETGMKNVRPLEREKIWESFELCLKLKSLNLEIDVREKFFDILQDSGAIPKHQALVLPSKSQSDSHGFNRRRSH